MSATKFVELFGVSKTYIKGLRRRPHIALEDINLTIEEGDSIGIVGHNGAGKSTAIRIMLGLQQASSGTVRLMGLDPRERDARRGVGFVPELPWLYDLLTPAELVRMALTAHQVPQTEIPNRTSHWLAAFGIAAVADKPLRAFSKGMAQRTALAMALAVEPKLLILDEPMSGLDPSGRKIVADVLQDFRTKGGTMLFSSHVLSDVERLASRYVFLSRGKVRTIKSASELVGDQAATYVVTIESKLGTAGFEALPGGRWRCEVPASRVPEVLAQLNSDTHFLLSVQPKDNLEQIYMQYASDHTTNASTVI